MSIEVLELIDSPSTVERSTINDNREENKTNGIIPTTNLIKDDKTICWSDKFRIWRNVTVLSLSFLLLLTACNVVSSLQVKSYIICSVGINHL